MLWDRCIFPQINFPYQPFNSASTSYFTSDCRGRTGSRKTKCERLCCERTRNGYAATPLVANSFVLLRWLRTCSTLEDVKRVHAVFLKYSWDTEVYVANKLVSVYSGLKLLTYARNVFDLIPRKNVVSYTAMIDGYANCSHDAEALEIFEDLVKDDVLGNAMTFVCMLNLCRKTLNFPLGKQIHTCIIKRDLKNVFVDSAVVHLYAHCGDLSSARKMFDGIADKDVISWTGLITAYAQQGKGKEGLQLFTSMLENNVTPNAFTICGALKACAEDKHLNLGRQLHALVAKKLSDEDKYVGTCLVDMYAKCGVIADARQVFDGMRNSNTVTWTSLIAGYARAGYGEEAISLYRIMKRRKIITNELTNVSVLKACGIVKACLLGRELHCEAIKTRTENGYLGSTLVWFYCKCGKSGYAERVLREMESRSVVTWTAMISGYAGLGHEAEALGMVRAMMEEGVRPNAYTVSSALKACAGMERVGEGKGLHTVTRKKPYLWNVYVGNAMIHMYAKCGHVEDAARVFDDMAERDLVSWRALILGYVRNGMFQDALKLVYRMQEDNFQVDDYTLATVLNGCTDSEFSS